MKKILFIPVLLLSMFAWQGCEKSNDSTTDPDGNEEVGSTFKAMYSDATGVEWEKKGDYWKADFRKGDKDMEAWFNHVGGAWCLTVTEISFDDLPEAVKTVFQSGDYKDWRVDDVDKVERKDMEAIYVLEVEKEDREFNLFYSSDGTLIKVADAHKDKDDHEHYLPSSLTDAIKTYISTNYPQARILEMEKEDGMIEVDIIDGTTHRKLLFSETGEWYQTKTKLAFDALPDAVKTALQSGDYKDWRVDKVKMIERKDMETVYVLEAEKGSQEYDLYYSSDGILIKAVSDDHDDKDDREHCLPSSLTDVIKTYISTNYPQARILEMEKEDGMIEVDIIDGTTYRELLFTAKGEWYQTKTKLTFDALPDAVKTAFQSGDYKDWRVDKVKMIENKDVGTSYVLDVEKGDKEYKLYYSADGTLVKAVEDH